MKEVNQFSRTETLIGKEGIEKLKKSKVAVFGIGGVGSFVVEGLARAGIENLIIVDFDKYDITNINRQLGALHSTIGKYKVDVMKERILDINPNVEVEIFKEFFGPNSNKNIIDKSIDYNIYKHYKELDYDLFLKFVEKLDFSNNSILYVNKSL